MPQGRDQTGDPDDLINELARLMAEGAKDTAPQARQVEPPADREEAPKPQPSADPFEEGFRALHPARSNVQPLTSRPTEPAPQPGPAPRTETPRAVERRAQPISERPASAQFDLGDRSRAHGRPAEGAGPSDDKPADVPNDPIAALILQRETDRQEPPRQADRRSEPSLFSKPSLRSSANDGQGSDRFCGAAGLR